MKKTAKKKNPAARKNPFPKVRAMQRNFKPAKRRNGRKRNPEMAGAMGAMGRPVEYLKFGLIALLGLVTTRQVPQMALGTKNTSWLGYAANLATALAGAYGTGKVAGKNAAVAFGTGGGLYTVNRILTDKLTPVGQVLSLAGLGDAQASATLGRIVPGSVYPPTYDANGNLKLPANFVAAMNKALPAPGTGPGKLNGVSRFSTSRIAA
jgi:hypothetical protein